MIPLVRMTLPGENRVALRARGQGALTDAGIVTATLDLDAYFERIGWGGATAPTLDTLSGVLSAHMACIPFENLDVLLGHPPRLDLDSLQVKLVRAHRGGYCFEQVTLFAAVLETLGFAPVRHSARVIMMAPRTAMPRTHMFVTVPLREGTFVVDPGFGLLAPRIPVPLSEDAKVTIGAESHWMIRDGAQWWTLRAHSGDKTVDAWTSTLEADNPIDFEMANHYTSTYPTSAFVNRIMLRALTPDGRVTVMNRDVTIQRGSTLETAQLADRRSLRRVLAEYFGFDLPEVETMRVPSIPEWA